MVGQWPALRPDVRGLAPQNVSEPEADLAASHRDVRRGTGIDVVLPLADLLYGVRGAVRVRGRGHVGRGALSVREGIARGGTIGCGRRGSHRTRSMRMSILCGGGDRSAPLSVF